MEAIIVIVSVNHCMVVDGDGDGLCGDEGGSFMHYSPLICNLIIISCFIFFFF